MIRSPILATGQPASEADFGLDRDPVRLARLLDEAGLELWQAPEGFWAIRIKPVPPLSSAPTRGATGRRRVR
jgi:hypothetical protein